MMHSIFGDNFFDDFMDDFPYYDDRDAKKAEKKLYGRRAGNLMQTDIKEKRDCYELEMDLPGFKKEEIRVSLENGCLTRVKETLKIRLEPDGTIADEVEGILSPDTVVSMNFWGFMPSFFDQLETYFYDFLRREAGDNIKAECLLPNLVGKLIAEKKMSVSVLHSADRWFGMTYHEDRQTVAQELQRLHDTGIYPKTLHQ